MKSTALLQARLSNQLLGAKKARKANEVVGWLGAIQAQDFAAAKWAIGMRMKKATDLDIEEAFNKGEILRTHIMRPTWHFVLPEDIRWMLELTTPRIKKILAHYDRRLELTDKLLTRCKNVIAKALQGENYLTREELSLELKSNKIEMQGQRLAHIMMHAELDQLICSGLRRGKQFTYALIEERAPKAKILTTEEALAKLALKYFTSHGPAQLKDFAWWSGLTVKEANTALEMMKSKLTKEEIDGKIYWHSGSSSNKNITNRAYLLSIYDEYTIAYKDRSGLSEEKYIEKLLSMGNALTAVIIFDGKVIGTWKKRLKKDTLEIMLQPLKKLIKIEKQALSMEVERYGEFLGMPINISDLK